MRETSADYVELITPQYQGSSKFLEWIDVLATDMQEVRDVVASMDLAFDLDEAIGDQLSTLGDIIGIGRNITLVLYDLFFSWDDGASPEVISAGWDAGSWRDWEEGPIWSTMSILPDDAYRQILRFKILQNSWKGTLQELYEAWYVIFAGENLLIDILDHQDMTMSITITGPVIPAVVEYVLAENYLPLKSAGVSITIIFNEL